jgi:hypothetical protein
MRPHAQHFDDVLFFQHLMNQPVLDIDAAGICALQVPKKFFKCGGF